MCLLVFAWKTQPTAPFVLVANRDELHARPSAPLEWWSQPRILGGRDLQSGGTWLAMDADGRLGAITNLRGAPTPSQAPSRGELIPCFLASGLRPADFLKALAPEVPRYAGFNLLLGNSHELLVLSSADPQRPRRLAAGIYAISNNPLDADWPKVRRARAALAAVLTESPLTTESLLETLADRTEADVQDLPQTGLTMARERTLSSAFIVDDTYGTRCTTAVHHRGLSIDVVEQSFTADGGKSGRRTERIDLQNTAE